MKFILLDVAQETFLQEHGRSIVILVVMALVATGAIVGIFIWRKKQKAAK